MTLEELKIEAHKLGYVLRKPRTEHKQVYIEEHDIVCDEKIAPLIYFLNDQGWKTDYSCQGHNSNGASGAYILIKDMMLVHAHRFARYGLVDNGVAEIRKDLEHSKPNKTRYMVVLRRDIVVQGEPTEGIDDIWIHDIGKEFGLTDDQIEQYEQHITDWKGEII